MVDNVLNCLENQIKLMNIFVSFVQDYNKTSVRLKFKIML